MWVKYFFLNGPKRRTRNISFLVDFKIKKMETYEKIRILPCHRILPYMSKASAPKK